MKHILVTGGAGFIGSHLCKRLVENGDMVYCLDNFFTGRIENVSDLLERPNFRLIEHDIVDPIDLKVDQIYNLACPASPEKYQYDAIKTLRTNLIGALNMLELARKYNALILQASTSEVYGDPLVHPQTEDYWGNVNPIGLRSCYDEGKRVAETAFFDYHRNYEVDIRVVRIFNTYGPNMRMDDGRVISNFIVQALNHRDITIYGEGSQTRSFCYVSDMIDGMLRVMSLENVTGPFNLGNPQELTILQLARQIVTMCNSHSEIVYMPEVKDDPARRKPCIEKIQSYTDWKPEIALEQGLEKTIPYFRTQI